MGSQPVYRYPPRSHEYNCPCPRCVQCRSRNQASGGWGIVVPFFLAAMFAVWPFAVWHGCKYGGGQDLSGCGAGSDWVWNARSWAACGIWWGFLAAGLAAAVFAGGPKRRPVPAKGRLRVEAAAPGQFRPPPASVCEPRCLHPDAVRVAGAAWPQVTLENWCPGCDAQLGAAFRWSCCSAPPGNSPGAGHLYNCPNRKEQP